MEVPLQGTFLLQQFTFWGMCLWPHGECVFFTDAGAALPWQQLERSQFG